MTTKEKNKEIEEKLLSADDMIKKGMELKIEEQIAEAKKPKIEKKITKFDDIATDLIFDIGTIYTCFNQETKQQTYVNGIVVDGIIGLNEKLRADFKAKTMDNFQRDIYVVKFDHRVEYTKEN